MCVSSSSFPPAPTPRAPTLARGMRPWFDSSSWPYFFLFRLETLFSPLDSRSTWGNRRGGSHETLAATTGPSHRISHTTACSASFRLRSGCPMDATSAVTEKNGAAGVVATDRSRPTAASGALARRSSLEIGCHGDR